MKKTDVAMIVLIASFSMLIAYFVANSFFGNMSTTGEKVDTVDAINSTIVEPSSTIFNKNAINPAVDVQINSSQSGTK